MRRHRRALRRLRAVRPPAVTKISPGASIVTYGEPPPRPVRVGPAAWMVRGAAPPRQRTKITKLDATTWLLTQGGRRRRTVRRLGPPWLRAHMVVDEPLMRDHMRKFQLQVLHQLADEHVAWILRELAINCVLDVGANRGQYALRLRRAGYSGRIVSFEPVSDVADELERHAAEDPDWHVMRLALGDSDTSSSMLVAGGLGQMSSLRSPSDFGRAWSSNLLTGEHEEVIVRRLDGLLDGLIADLDEPRLYLKLDTQGYDLAAFAGAGDRIAEVLGMQSEVACVPIYDGMPRLPEQIAVYESSGFELTGMYPVTIDRDTLRVIEFDAVMIRPGARRVDEP